MAFFPYVVVVVIAAIAAPLALGGWLFKRGMYKRYYRGKADAATTDR